MKIFRFLMRIILPLVTCLIPKNEKTYIFGGWFGTRFSDSPKEFYLYLKSKSIDLNLIWISKDRKQVQQLVDEGINAFYAYSAKGIWSQTRAKACFLTHSIYSDFNTYIISHNVIRIQMWHGIALKKIGFDDLIYTNKKSSFLTSRLVRFLKNEHFDYYLSTGKECSRIFSSAFRDKKDKMLEVGFPRNDVFFRAVEKSNKMYEIIYMPTFRGGVGDAFDLFDGFDFEKFDKNLNDNGMRLTLRTHPANTPSKELIEKIESCKSMRISNENDIYETINQYDCLITDYSSIMFDFMLSNKEIIFAPFDMQNYINNDRELYYSYSKISLGDEMFSWDDVFTKIESLKCRKDIQSDKLLEKKERIEYFHDEVNQHGQYSESLYNSLKDKNVFN